MDSKLSKIFEFYQWLFTKEFNRIIISKNFCLAASLFESLILARTNSVLIRSSKNCPAVKTDRLTFKHFKNLPYLLRWKFWMIIDSYWELTTFNRKIFQDFCEFNVIKSSIYVSSQKTLSSEVMRLCKFHEVYFKMSCQRYFESKLQNKNQMFLLWCQPLMKKAI